MPASGEDQSAGAQWPVSTSLLHPRDPSYTTRATARTRGCSSSISTHTRLHAVSDADLDRTVCISRRQHATVSVWATGKGLCRAFFCRFMQGRRRSGKGCPHLRICRRFASATKDDCRTVFLFPFSGRGMSAELAQLEVAGCRQSSACATHHPVAPRRRCAVLGISFPYRCFARSRLTWPRDNMWGR